MNNRCIFISILVFGVWFGLSGCLEIHERITFNRDFSGLAEYTFDYSRVNQLGVGLFPDISDTTQLNTLNHKLLDSLVARVQLLTDVQGIEAIELLRPVAGKTLQLRFSFQNLESLTNAYALLFLTDSVPSPVPVYDYNPVRGEFHRMDALYPYVSYHLTSRLDSTAFIHRYAFDSLLNRLQIKNEYIFRGRLSTQISNPKCMVRLDTLVNKVSYYEYVNRLGNFQNTIKF